MRKAMSWAGPIGGYRPLDDGRKASNLARRIHTRDCARTTLWGDGGKDLDRVYLVKLGHFAPVIK